jgi:hypothetical protein
VYKALDIISNVPHFFRDINGLPPREPKNDDLHSELVLIYFKMQRIIFVEVFFKLFGHCREYNEVD